MKNNQHITIADAITRKVATCFFQAERRGSQEYMHMANVLKLSGIIDLPTSIIDTKSDPKSADCIHAASQYMQMAQPSIVPRQIDTYIKSTTADANFLHRPVLSP